MEEQILPEVPIAMLKDNGSSPKSLMHLKITGRKLET